MFDTKEAPNPASIDVVMGGGPVNQAPVVSISAPGNNDSFTELETIRFTASASDAEEGDLSAQLAWSSSRDGNIGAGGSFDATGLSVGTHAITASVTDMGGTGATGSMTISIDVTAVGGPNQPPDVTITAPADGASFSEDLQIDFIAVATDPEEGDLTDDLTWVSTIDGIFGFGGTVSTSDLSVGAHDITATVTDMDSAGETGLDTISIEVTAGPPPDQAPVVSISSPSSGDVFTDDQFVSFVATANDAEDGDLTAEISWESDVDGPIGNGGTFDTDALSIGVHLITASVTDNGGAGQTGHSSVSIEVVPEPPPNQPPTVQINAPSDNDTFTELDSIAFAATASDNEEGDLTGSLTWSSSIDGTIGMGGSFNTTSLSVGVHQITATVTDMGGAGETGSSTILIEVTAVGGGGTITLDSAGDSFTRAPNPTTNYGNRDFMRVRAPGEKISFVQFDLSNLSGTPVSATLNLYVQETRTPGTLNVNEILEPWLESSITHDNRPLFDPAPVTTTMVASGDTGGIIQIDVTGLVQQWASDPANAFGVALTAADSLHVLFDTEETPNPPYIEVVLQ